MEAVLSSEHSKLKMLKNSGLKESKLSLVVENYKELVEFVRAVKEYGLEDKVKEVTQGVGTTKNPCIYSNQILLKIIVSY